MLSVQKSLRLALAAAITLVVSAVESQAAAPRFVFGKEPVARHNRAVAARRMQASYAYKTPSNNRMTMPSSQSYGGTAMVQTYPVPQRSYVTPASGYRPQMAANNGQMVR
jgi:hypothetical protein